MRRVLLLLGGGLLKLRLRLAILPLRLCVPLWRLCVLALWRLSVLALSRRRNVRRTVVLLVLHPGRLP